MKILKSHEMTISWITIHILIVSVLLLSSGCTDEKDKKIAELTKKVEEQSKQINQDKANQDMALQVECGKNAWQYNKRVYPNENHYYTNHYNKRLNKCFILGQDISGKLRTKLMMDINENKTYAEFDFYDNAVSSCYVLATSSTKAKAEPTSLQISVQFVPYATKALKMPL